MKKKFLSLLLLAGLILSTTAADAAADPVLPINAGKSDWHVSFEDPSRSVLDSDFGRQDIDEVVSKMQPGDSAEFRITLTNKNTNTTDWYMKNTVLYSLEERSANTTLSGPDGEYGGAYTYKLVYTDQDGVEMVLFNSDTVGGEITTILEGDRHGLKEASEGLEEWLWLDTLDYGQNGYVTLRVVLDGETQGNDYQDTIADLAMEFAVELIEPETQKPTEPETPDESSPAETTEPQTTPKPTSPKPTTPQPTTKTPTQPSKPPKTGDDTRLVLYSTIAGASGTLALLLGIFAFLYRRRSREDDGRGEN